MNHSIQVLIKYFECTYKQKLDILYEKIHPCKKIVEFSQAIIKKYEIEKELLNEYIDNYIQKIIKYTQENLDKFLSQILQFVNNKLWIWMKILKNNQFSVKSPQSLETHYNQLIVLTLRSQAHKFNLRMISRLPRHLIKSVSFIIQERKNKQVRHGCKNEYPKY
ncbi:unnamed protein product (macronuclear) [Paramecium tetraurelia]|uniref:Uncharacterized protein n=1 Tax=Paramecium tetraurelia TaxID=5888 RepID=A0E8M6_PARTE|nr:uncharacterized protein GSPATT00024372001 [Paramecium tetraurelia]CAK91643.1 unnamed protein product [Paramecium tetraurelia]|eukprot:XP_001459040.1 hypothetical protein (macronuclear) [Paramecium tetraurelia strain d4-2]